MLGAEEFRRCVAREMWDGHSHGDSHKMAMLRCNICTCPISNRASDLRESKLDAESRTFATQQLIVMILSLPRLQLAMATGADLN